jgi:lipopolysaccharide transport system ATP-binding protein
MGDLPGFLSHPAGEDVGLIAMSTPLLKVQGLSKIFCRDLKRSLWYGVQDLCGELLLRRTSRSELRKDEFWSLKEVSFELHRGETLGLVGHNGAGKSTLLKLIHGLFKPDAGSIRIQGRVGALIELGMGFNPILTGRENIYVNAAILGLSRREVVPRLDRIIDFADIGKAIDAPLQSYSSGMKVRLGFAIASLLDPDILLIDEILSVGDSSFRERCYNRLRDYKKQGGAIIFVSHNSAAVEAISDRVMWLDHGKLTAIGAPADVLERYEKHARELSDAAALRLGRQPVADEEILIKAVKCYDLQGQPQTVFDFGESFEIRIEFQADTEIVDPYFLMHFTKGSFASVPFATISMVGDGTRLGAVKGQGVISCVVKNPCMTPGEYGLVVGVQKSLTLLLGKKYYASLRLLARMEIRKDKYLDRHPAVPAFQLGNLAPVAFDYEWNFPDQVLPESSSDKVKAYT